jgi:hypothetical protein
MRIVEDGVAGRMIGAARPMGCGEGTTPGWRAPRVTRIVTDPACVITDLPTMAMTYRRRAPLDGAPCPSLGRPGTRPKHGSEPRSARGAYPARPAGAAKLARGAPGQNARAGSDRRGEPAYEQLKQRLEQRPPDATTFDVIREFLATLEPPNETITLRLKILRDEGLRDRLRARYMRVGRLLADSIAKDLGAAPTTSGRSCSRRPPPSPPPLSASASGQSRATRTPTPGVSDPRPNVQRPARRTERAPNNSPTGAAGLQ